MRAFRFMGILLTGALGACGSVDDRSSCSASADCPAGQYCAHTADGNVCWADAVPPTVSNVTVWCAFGAAGGACLRDGVLRVTATVTDDHEVLGAEVALDVGGAPVQLVRDAAGAFTGDIQLASVPFDHFEHAVVVTVTARDGARNTTLEPAAAGTVTRHLRKTTLGAGLAAPSVSAAGVLAVPANNGKVHLLNWDGQYISSVELAVNIPQVITAATSSNDSFWVGAEDGNVYEVLQQNGAWASVARGSTGGPVHGALALTASGTIIAGSEAGVVYAVTSTTIRNGSVGQAISVGPVIDPAGSIFAVAAGAARRLHLQLGIPTDDWGSPVALSGTVGDPLACTTSLFAIASTGSDGILKRVLPSGDPQSLATTALPSGGAAILSDNSILVPEQTKTISRWTSAGNAFPGWQKPDLGGATRTPLVTTAATSPFIVPTAKGAIHALRGDGTVAWSAQLSAGTASLQPGNIYTPPGQITGRELSTAYFAGSDGVLHAVIVDGRLDGSAPWPKAFHDPRNTNRAGTQP